MWSDVLGIFSLKECKNFNEFERLIISIGFAFPDEIFDIIRLMS